MVVTPFLLDVFQELVLWLQVIEKRNRLAFRDIFKIFVLISGNRQQAIS